MRFILSGALALSLSACIQEGGGGGGGGGAAPAPTSTADVAQALTERVEQNLSTLDELLSIARDLPMADGLEPLERPDIEELRAWLTDVENIESQRGTTTVYRVKPEDRCDPDFDGPECLAEAERNPVRVVVASGDPMRIEFQLGASQHTVLELELGADRVAVTVDIAEAVKGALETAGEAPIRIDQAAGTVKLSLQKVEGGAEIEAKIEGLTLRGALDGEAFSVVAQQERIALGLVRAGGEPSLTAQVLVAGIEVSLPVCEEEGRCEVLGLEVPRIELNADTAGEAITLAWKQAGAVEALLNGARLLGYELGDTQVTLAPTAAGTEAVFSPGIDLELAIEASRIAELLPELFEDGEGGPAPRDEVLTMTFDGAPNPTLAIGDEVTRIVAGTLRMTSSEESFEASAPACLADGEDGLQEVACP